MNHQGAVVWLTGLSGSGKTTIAQIVVGELRNRGAQATLLDGDALRMSVSKDLGFSRADRAENVRRVGLMAGTLCSRGMVTLVALVSPYRDARDAIRRQEQRFVEVYVNAPLEVCEQRDPKGLYRKARLGELTLFTGISDPYEPPLNPEVECRTDRESVDESAAKVLLAIERLVLPAGLESRPVGA